MIKCISAAIESYNLRKANERVNWNNIRRKSHTNCYKILNISPKLNLKNIEHIPLIEKKCKLKINVYKLNKIKTDVPNEDFDYTLDLFWKTRNCKSHYRKINLVLYTENGNRHCYLIKNDFTTFINNFASLRLKKKKCCAIIAFKI